jgi:hypothetical protein
MSECCRPLCQDIRFGGGTPPLVSVHRLYLETIQYINTVKLSAFCIAVQLLRFWTIFQLDYRQKVVSRLAGPRRRLVVDHHDWDETLVSGVHWMRPGY